MVEGKEPAWIGVPLRAICGGFFGALTRYVENLIKEDLGWERQKAVGKPPATAEEFDRRFDAGEDLADLGVDLSKAKYDAGGEKLRPQMPEEPRQAQSGPHRGKRERN